jgi:hypothetical protein
MMVDVTHFESAWRLSEMILACAFMQQSVEHLTAAHKAERLAFALRFILSAMLLVGLFAPYVCLALFMLGIWALRRFNGPYNGGSDRMNMLILSCLCVMHFLPSLRVQECVFGYLALQLVLSYFMAGKVKVMNPEWRSGRALQDVFAFSAYPVSTQLRALAGRPRILWVMSWAVICFELFFPLAILSQTTLIAALCLAALFHLANAVLFGLNRFFWIWLAAFPALIWLQERVFMLG